jgi:hypothetical protein
VVVEEVTEVVHTGPRRLIVVVVAPGEDPELETDPPDSFVAYEIIAALKRAIEIVEEEEVLSQLPEEDD